MNAGGHYVSVPCQSTCLCCGRRGVQCTTALCVCSPPRLSSSRDVACVVCCPRRTEAAACRTVEPMLWALRSVSVAPSADAEGRKVRFRIRALTMTPFSSRPARSIQLVPFSQTSFYPSSRRSHRATIRIPRGAHLLHAPESVRRLMSRVPTKYHCEVLVCSLCAHYLIVFCFVSHPFNLSYLGYIISLFSFLSLAPCMSVSTFETSVITYK